MVDRVAVDSAISAFEHEHIWWDETLRAIGEDRMDEPGFMGEWSARDLVAHLSGWQWKMVASMRRALAGEGSDYPATPWPAELNDDGNWEEDGDFEPINQWLHAQAQATPVEKLLETSRGQWNEIRSMINGMTVEQMTDPNLIPRLEGRSLVETLLSGDFFGHFREHRDDDIEPWLAKHGRR